MDAEPAESWQLLCVFAVSMDDTELDCVINIARFSRHGTHAHQFRTFTASLFVMQNYPQLSRTFSDQQWPTGCSMPEADDDDPSEEGTTRTTQQTSNNNVFDVLVYV